MLVEPGTKCGVNREGSKRPGQVDNAGRSYSYRIVASPLPIENYLSAIKAVEADGGCDVEWTSTFDVVGAPAEEISSMIQGLYEAGMRELRERFSS